MKYIHIGASLKYASYTIDNISTANKNSLDIWTDCRVELYKVENNAEVLISNDYSTKTEYRNDTNEDILVSIDTANFVSIQNSSKPISYTSHNGIIVSYITIAPHESLTSISILGTTYTEKEKYTISDILKLEIDDKLYICKNARGFIIRKANKKEFLATINKDNINLADIYYYEGLPDNTNGCFVVDEKSDIVIHGAKFERNFETSFIRTTDGNEYIAYNSETLLRQEIDTKLVNTFAPLLDMNKLMYYQIDNVITRSISADITFIKNYNTTTEFSDWSLGKKDIHIKCNFDFHNTDEYGVDINQLKNIFAISNNIKLEDSYTLNGEKINLSRYIITPPDDMVVNYEIEDVSESIIIEEDLFNKLYYSNLSAIISISTDNITLSSADYSLLNEAGIIIWNADTYIGQTITITYSYKKPISLSFKNLDSLYELVGYSTDAYKIINKEPIILKDVRNNDSYTIDFDGKIPDKIIVRCDNANFGAIVDKNTVTAKLINKEDLVQIKQGYFYDNNYNEYFLFEHMKSDSIDKWDMIELHYVKKKIDFLQFMQATTNHVLDTVMTNSFRNEELCYINFASQKGIDGISKLNSLSACDTYESWDSFRMNISLETTKNNLGIKFENTEDSGYAILNISKVVKPNTIISLMASSTLQVYIAREIKAGDDSMVKSTFVEPIELFTQQDNNKYYAYIFNSDIDLSYKYYILVKGYGIIDDIIAKEYIEPFAYFRVFST